MARNQEKANLMFNRWTTMREEVDRGGPAECVAWQWNAGERWRWAAGAVRERVRACARTNARAPAISGLAGASRGSLSGRVAGARPRVSERAS